MQSWNLQHTFTYSLIGSHAFNFPSRMQPKKRCSHCYYSYTYATTSHNELPNLYHNHYNHFRTSGIVDKRKANKVQPLLYAVAAIDCCGVEVGDLRHDDEFHCCVCWEKEGTPFSRHPAPSGLGTNCKLLPPTSGWQSSWRLRCRLSSRKRRSPPGSVGRQPPCVFWRPPRSIPLSYHQSPWKLVASVANLSISLSISLEYRVDSFSVAGSIHLSHFLQPSSPGDIRKLV